jgi:hypothetical protein
MARGRRVSDQFITTEVNASSGLKAAQAAIECHKSQWTPQQMAGMAKLAEAWSRVSLRLALSTVGMAQGKELDVFERVK